MNPFIARAVRRQTLSAHMWGAGRRDPLRQHRHSAGVNLPPGATDKQRMEHGHHDSSGTRERRIYPRHHAYRPAKLAAAGLNSACPAQTQDYSAGGTLLDVHAVRPLTPGQRVEVWIEFKVTGVIPASALHAGTIVRAVAIGGGQQRVAVRFDRVLNRAGD